MNKFLNLILISAILSLTGCFQITTTVNIKTDGSGEIIESVKVAAGTPALLEGMIEGTFKELLGDTTATLPTTKSETESAGLIPEQNVNYDSLNYLLAGKTKYPGATFKTIEKKTEDGFDVVNTIYSFKSINDIDLSEALDSDNASANEFAKAFVFNYSKENKTLNIKSNVADLIKEDAKKKKAERATEEPAPAEDDTTKTAEPQPDMNDQFAKQMMAMMFKDMRMNFVLKFEGGIESSNALFTKDNEVTLIDLQFGKMIENEKFLNAATNKDKYEDDPMAALQVMKDIEGFQMDFQPKITIKLK
jgi:hypothetical protein